MKRNYKIIWKESITYEAFVFADSKENACEKLLDDLHFANEVSKPIEWSQEIITD